MPRRKKAIKKARNRNAETIQLRETQAKQTAEFEAKTKELVRLHLAKAIDLKQPTNYPPGSPWKVAVIGARRRLGIRSLFVEGDRDEWPSGINPGSPRPRERSAFFECGAPVGEEVA